MRQQTHPSSALHGSRCLCVVLAHISETPCIVYLSVTHALSRSIYICFVGVMGGMYLTLLYFCIYIYIYMEYR
jgi:hypothetical protein